MTILASAHNLAKLFAGKTLFSGIQFSVESGERVGLIGPNGAGKSTLLRIVAGDLLADEGTVALQKGLKVGFLAQTPVFTEGATIESTLVEGVADPQDPMAMNQLEALASRLSLKTLPQGIATPVADLSGGWKKRVALGRELMKEPELLLLDEPTNHLDVESILWLENFLVSAPFAVVAVTHDRAFLQKIATRILELDPRHASGLLSVRGDYARYLETREQLLSAQQALEAKWKNTMRREMEWLRRGAQARSTKQQARIDRAEGLASDLQDLQKRNQVRIMGGGFQSAQERPNILVEAKSISKSFTDRLVVPPTSLTITAKTRLGLLGPNGCGKSTLIRLLMGELSPDSGTVKRAEHFKPIYFAQQKDTIPPQTTVLRAVCPAGDHVTYQGKRLHIRSYLDRFMFSAQQMDTPMVKLSGGEQSRVALAQLMLVETNFLVLDEPTNDLDLATLDVLQEHLEEFPGAVLLVSHDRFFLDQVTREIIAFDTAGPDKKLISFFGTDQWESWHQEQNQRLKSGKDRPVAEPKQTTPASSTIKKKLSYKDQRELDQMESRIASAEENYTKLEQESLDPKNATNSAKLGEIAQQMNKLRADIDRLYARWQELEA